MKQIETTEELIRTLYNQHWIAVETPNGMETISTGILMHAPIIHLIKALTEGKLYSCPN